MFLSKNLRYFKRAYLQINSNVPKVLNLWCSIHTMDGQSNQKQKNRKSKSSDDRHFLPVQTPKSQSCNNVDHEQNNWHDDANLSNSIHHNLKLLIFQIGIGNKIDIAINSNIAMYWFNGYICSRCNGFLVFIFLLINWNFSGFFRFFILSARSTSAY